MKNPNELDERLITINNINNQLDINILLQGSYDTVNWDQELNKINSLNVQSLNIDCSIDFIEFESHSLIKFLNSVLEKVAENLNNISIKFSIHDCQVPDEIDDEIDDEICDEIDNYKQNIIDSRNRWMKDISNLQAGFKLLSNLTHFRFIFSLDEETYAKFYVDVSDSEFLQLYHFDPILDLLKSQSVYKTLQQISLKLEYVEDLDDEKEMELLKVFSENPSLETLEIDSKDGFQLSFPENAFKYSINNLMLSYDNCIYDIDSLDHIKEIGSHFTLSNFKLNISSSKSNYNIKLGLDRLSSLREDLISYRNIETVSFTGNDFDRLPPLISSQSNISPRKTYVIKHKNKFFDNRPQAGAENQSVQLVHEDSSTALIPNFAESVEFQKRFSNCFLVNGFKIKNSFANPWFSSWS